MPRIRRAGQGLGVAEIEGVLESVPVGVQVRGSVGVGDGLVVFVGDEKGVTVGRGVRVGVRVRVG